MKRREFCKKGVFAGIISAAAFSMAPYGYIIANTTQIPSIPYDLVAVKGGEVDLMFDRAIQALGGMGAFVKKGQKVVVKPNIGWDVIPERAANTNPHLVKRIIEHCFMAGAREVFVFDHTCDTWGRCYKNSGIERAAKEAGAKIVPGNVEKYYQRVDVPGGKKLKQTKVHELILDSDVFINVPILKSHGSARLTISMKNLMGIVWDRRWWHANGLHQCIADFATYRKPDLNIVDAYNVMMKNGPRGVSRADVSTMKYLIVSNDMVAADSAASKIFGMDPTDVRYIGMADQLGAGVMKLDQLNIKRITL